MAKTEVILTHNIVGLGGESDQVKVAAGYARNYLFPQGLAIPVTGANKRRLEAFKQRRAEREAHELNTMTELAKSISKLICVVTVKTGEDGKMFGTVTSGMIADQLKTSSISLSTSGRSISSSPSAPWANTKSNLRLHADVDSKLKVRVESSTPLPTPAAEAGAEGKEGQRTEKRGRRTETASATGDKAPAGDRKGGPGPIAVPVRNAPASPKAQPKLNVDSAAKNRQPMAEGPMQLPPGKPIFPQARTKVRASLPFVPECPTGFGVRRGNSKLQTPNSKEASRLNHQPEQPRPNTNPPGFGVRQCCAAFLISFDRDRSVTGSET